MRSANNTTHIASPKGRRLQRLALAIALVTMVSWGFTACGGGEDGSGAQVNSGGSAENVVGGIGGAVTVGDAVITIKSLEAAFQPVSPAQRLSDDALVAPASGITFYQAYVHIENLGQAPLRVDPEDFVCQVGNVISTLEPTRSGPLARSIIFGTSLDLLLTFRGATGIEPTLIYNPPWYSGLILFGENIQASGGSTSQSVTTTTETPAVQ